MKLTVYVQVADGAIQPVGHGSGSQPASSAPVSSRLDPLAQLDPSPRRQGGVEDPRSRGPQGGAQPTGLLTAD